MGNRVVGRGGGKGGLGVLRGGEGDVRRGEGAEGERARL